MEIINNIKKAYQRVIYHIDDDQWENFDEYRAVVTQHKIARLLSFIEDEEDMKDKKILKWYKILQDISFGMGSYIEMCSGVYTMDSKEYKKLEKEWINAEQLLIKHYKSIWTR